MPTEPRNDADAADGVTRRLPLFPLGTVLFPDGLLPLQVFEVRYLNMIGQCLRGGQPFGVVHLAQGHEVRRPGQTETLSPVGTSAAIVAHQQPQPGLLRIECAGLRRFRLAAAHQEKNGLWVGDVQWLPPDAPDWTVPADLEPAARLLAQWIAGHPQASPHAPLAAEDAPHAGADTPPANIPDTGTLDATPRLFHGDPRLAEAGWVANRWCDILPLPIVRKQQLLQIDSPVLRLELVADVLRQHGLIN